MPKTRTRWNRFALLLMTIFIGVPLVSVVAADQTSNHEEGLKSNPASVWALQHAKVVTRAGNQIDDATIVIRNGRIALVQAEAAAPKSARIIDLSGKTIYPGFIDAYAEIKTEASTVVQANGYWNPNVVPQVSVSSAYQKLDDNDAVRAQGFVARLIAPSEKIVRGTSAVVSTSGAEFRLALINPNVAQHMQLTVMSRGRDTYPGSPMGAVALARQAMYDAKWYGKAWVAASANKSLPRPEYNDALEALQPVITGQQPAFIETYNELYFLRAVRFAEEFGLNLIVRGSGHEYRRLQDIAATRRPVILPLNFEKAPNVSTVEGAANVTLESLMHWDIAPENPARVAQAGMTFAFTTEGVESSDKFLKALRLAVDRGLDSADALRALTETPAHGLDKVEALKSVTLYPAQILGVDTMVGSLKPGKHATLIVTTGDPLETDTSVTSAWIKGRRVQLTSRHTRLYEKYKQKYEQLELQP